MNPSPQTRPKGNLLWLVILLILIILGALAFYFYFLKANKTAVTASPAPTLSASLNSSPAASSVGGWQKYTNSNKGFSIQYPIDWNIDTQANFDNRFFKAPADVNTMSPYEVFITVKDTAKSPADYLTELNALPTSEKEFRSYGTTENITEYGKTFFKVSDVTAVTNPAKSDWYMISKAGKMYIIKVMKTQGEGTPYDLDNLITQAELMVGTFAFL